MTKNLYIFRLCLMIFVLLLSSGLPIRGEDFVRSSTPIFTDSLGLSSLTFNRELNTYIWSGNFQKEIHSGVWSADIHQLFYSRLIKTDRIAIQDQYQGTISLNAKLSSKWNLEIQNASTALADNQVIDLARMAQHKLLGGLKYVPSPNIIAEMAGGYEINSQAKEVDRGFAYELGFDARDIKLEEFDAFFQSSWNQSNLDRRSPRTGDIALSLFRDFGEGVSDSLTISYNTQRREFYIGLNNLSQVSLGIQHNIFRRDANVLDIANQIKYRLGSDFFLTASLGLTNTVIDRMNRFKDYLNPQFVTLDTRIQEMQMFGFFLIRWHLLYWLDTDFKLAYVEREEKHSVENDPMAPDSTIRNERLIAKRLENTAQRTTFTAGLTSRVTRKDTIRFVSSASILRYDTPDSLNTDDRDELLLTYGAEISHRFSPYLFMIISADLTLFHLVYLHSDQSANNNWNRVIRLSPRIEYMPIYWFRTVVRAEVLANYTISDYEEQVASVRSFSFRQATWSDSTTIQINSNIKFNFSGSLRIFERGVLRWKEFKEIPEEYFIEKTLWPEIVWSSAIGLKVGVGFRYFGQDRYNYRGSEKIFSQGIESLGPTALFEWSGLGGEKIVISGWHEEQKRDGKTTSIISNLSIQVGLIL